MTSRSVADTKKYCCLRRSSFPPGVESEGYSTEEMASARSFAAMAAEWSPALKAPKSNSLEGMAAHRRRLMVLKVSKPGMGESYAMACTTSPPDHTARSSPSGPATFATLP